MNPSPQGANWLTWTRENWSEALVVSGVRWLSGLYAGGGLAVLVLALFRNLGSADRVFCIASGIAGIAVGVTLFLRRPELPDYLSASLVLLGTTWMGAVAYSLSFGGGLFLLSWFAPASFALLSARVAFAGAIYAAAIPGIILGTNGSFDGVNASTAWRDWISVVAVIAAVSFGISYLSRRLAERERVLTTLARGLPIGIEILGPELRYVAVNPVFCAMVDRPLREIVGQRFEEFTASDDVDRTRTTIESLLSGSRSSAILERALVRPDGGLVHVIVASTAVVPTPGGPRFVVGLAQDVSEQRRLDERRSQLAQQLMRAQEDERRRIADEVHDDPLQSIIALSIHLQILEGRTSDPGLLDVVGEIKETVALAIEQMRSLLFELHPPALQFGGLSESLREFIERYERIGGPPVEFQNLIEAEPTAEEAIMLFRITAEALTNARKHADARRISVSLMDSQGGIALAVSDDGIGMDDGGSEQISPGHLGVASMRERAERAGGSFEISSKPGAGTTVRAWVPRERSKLDSNS